MIPRGIRNNNPGNIEKKDKWIGLSEKQTDSRFATFTSVKWGIRAINKILNSYARRGIVTIEEIVNTWAPPIENDTESYIKTVEIVSGLSRNIIIDSTNRLGVIKGIITQENGKKYVPKDSTIRKGIELT